MERLTHERKSGMKTGYWSPNKKQELVDRLAMYENQEEKCQFGKWIPISERLPGAGEYILVSFANEGFSLPDIAVYEVDSYGNGVFYPADRTVPYSLIGVFVNAWMPLPESYKEEK